MGEEGEGCEPLTSDESDESDASACWRRRVVGILEPAEWLLARLRVGSLAEMEEARRRSDARPALANSILENKRCWCSYHPLRLGAWFANGVTESASAALCPAREKQSVLLARRPL